MRYKGDLPAFSEHIIEINKKLSSLHSINFSSDRELSNTILKDLSLTNKLLRVVNSAFYGSMRGKVATISRAVFLLGFDKVRMAAASLIIFDYLQNKSQTADLKDAALSSFLSAVIARDVADDLKYKGSEEVFICALLHNIGKHLVICHFPEEYEEIKKTIALQGIDEQQASKQILGVSYSDLGIGITKSWNFPDSIIGSMEIIGSKQTKAAATEMDILKSIANYANELCATVAEVNESKREEKLKNLAEKYMLSLHIPAERTSDLIGSATAKIDTYTDMIKIDTRNSELMRHLISYCQEKIPQDKLRHLGLLEVSPEASENSSIDPMSSSSTREAQMEILKSSIKEIDEALRSDSSLSDTMYMILETMFRGFEFNRVLFCMLDQSRTKMVARFGFGENIDDFIGKFEFKIVRSSDFFNNAVMRLQDFLIDDMLVSGVRENLPNWYLQNVSVRSILIYPLIIKEKCIGLFYADKKTTGILNDDQKDYMNILRNKAAWIILHKH